MFNFSQTNVEKYFIVYLEYYLQIFEVNVKGLQNLGHFVGELQVINRALK